MIIHSEATSTFAKKVLFLINKIVVDEMKLKMKRNRIFYNNFSIRPTIVIFDETNRLGFYDQHLFQIGINMQLMYSAKKDVLKNILRHELAHMVVSFDYKKISTPHGKEFHEICSRYFWNEEVKKASSCIELENDKIEGDLNSERVIIKVKKLLALATSSNKHEAELATIKANKILIEHNLHSSNLDKDSSDRVFVKRVLSGKRRSAKHQAISNIIGHFFVSPIFNCGQGKYYLELIGTKTNVELGSYVASFLDSELEHLWIKTQKEHNNIKGLGAKNSFMRGIAIGFDEKMKATKRQAVKEKSNKQALSIIEANLAAQLAKVYPRLSQSYSNARSFCKQADSKGREIGKRLSINKGISKNRSSLLLPFTRR